MPEYEPTGRAAVALAAMRNDPDPRRVWSSSQLAAAMGCDITEINARMKAAVKNGAVHYRCEGWGRSEWRLIPFDAPPAAMKGETTATGWRPPQMVAVRPGSENPQPREPAKAVDVPVFLASGPVAFGPNHDELPSVEEAKPEVKPEVAAALEDAKAGLGMPQQWEPKADDPGPDPADEAQEPDAWLSARTGAVVLTGVVVDPDGSITLLPELVRAIVRLASGEVRP